MERKMTVYEFTDHHDFFEACQKAQLQKVRFKAYSPLPEDDVLNLLDTSSSKLAKIAFACGCIGLATGFLLQYYPNVFGYPMNIGGKPTNSWPAFMLITFEVTILFTGFGILGSFIFLNGYPRYDRTIFSLEQFNERRDDHFFITTYEEVKDVKAHELYVLSAP
jgi:hypothetical protein